MKTLTPILVGMILASLALTADASASTSTFYGTSGVDVIVVGRVASGSSLVYAACINGAWVPGGDATGSSDSIYVYGYAGGDSITIRATDGWQSCGSDPHYLFRLDYSRVCPGYTYVYGGTGGDVIIGGACAERLYGDAGTDTIYGNGGYDYLYGGDDGDCIDDEDVNYLSCGSGSDWFTDSGTWGDCESRQAVCLLPL